MYMVVYLILLLFKSLGYHLARTTDGTKSIRTSIRFHFDIRSIPPQQYFLRSVRPYSVNSYLPWSIHRRFGHYVLTPNSINFEENLWITKDFIMPDNEDTDKTGRVRRLICVFVGRTCKKVHSLTLRLNYALLTLKAPVTTIVVCFVVCL